MFDILIMLYKFLRFFNDLSSFFKLVSDIVLFLICLLKFFLFLVLYLDK